MSKKPLSEREELLSKGSPTREHIDPATGLVPEGLYEGSGHSRMDADTIAAANRPQDQK